MLDRVSVYLITRDGAVKIGISADPQRRARALTLASGLEARVHTTLGPMQRWVGRVVERWLHEKHADARLFGEWFHPRIMEAVRADLDWVAEDEGNFDEVVGRAAQARDLFRWARSDFDPRTEG